MSKTPSTAILFNLPEEQQAELAQWLLGGTPYHEAKLLVQQKFGVVVKSLDTFSQFWQQVCAPALIAKRRRMSGLAKARADEAEKHPALFNAATLDALREKAYDLSESPTASMKDVKAVLGLLLKARGEDRADEQLKLEREKLALAQRQIEATKEQVAKLRDVKAPMTDEDRRAIIAKIDEIMGIPPMKK